MNPRERRGYKTYLEPGSEDPVPSSSWYRFKKRARAEEQVADPHSQNTSAGESMVNESAQNDNVEYDEPTEAPGGSENRPIAESEAVIRAVRDDSCPDDLLTANPLQCNEMRYLAEEIDVIENDMKNRAEEENEDVPDYFANHSDDDDFFMDAIDNDESDVLNVTGSENVFQQGFTGLGDLIENGTFNKPINIAVNKTVGEVVLVILKFVLVHALSLTQTTDLFRMINCIFAEPILPNTRYLLDKLFSPKNCMTLHAICSTCGAGMGKFERKDQSIRCKICKTDNDVKDDTYKDFFVMMDVASPISKLIESNSDYYSDILNVRVHEPNLIRDVYDGNKYRKFVQNLNPSDRYRYATVTFNTDGAPLFESSSYSIWPIFIMVNELPLHVRTKELILVGLWFGRDKPNMNVFLEPFVEYMNELSSKGVECNVNGKKMCIKIFNLICCVDAVARAPVQGFTQFNGAYGCGQCLHPGEWVRSNPNNSRAGNIKYPLQNNVPKDRSVEETIQHMQQAVESNNVIFGVKQPSQLINLTGYDIISGCLVDSLHCCSGIAKQFATMWFGNKKKSGLLPKSRIREIDTLMNNIKAPHQVGRLARSFGEKEFWKAREWENWTIFYSMVILKDTLPHNLLMHWALFVEAFYILSKGELTFREVDVADELLREFVCRTEILYGKIAMTFNVHSLLHLARSFSDWGPLWSHNTYAFESGNGDLLKVIHAAKGVHHQICRRISFRYSYLTLESHALRSSSFSVKHYCRSIGATMAKHTFKVNEVRYFGSVARVDELWSQKLNLGERSVSYQKMVKNSCLYMSSLKCNKRSNNSFAILKNNTFVKLHHFIVDFPSQQEYTIVTEVYTTNAFNDVCGGFLQKIVNTANDQSTVSTHDIAKVCVHMTSAENEYLCAVPNLWYY